MAASNVGIFEDNLLTLYGLLFENWITRDGSFEFSVLRFWLLFRSVLVFIAVWGYTVLKHLLSVFPKIANGFSDLVSDVIFDFSYFGSGSSSIWAATMILNSRETSACFTCHRNVKIYRFWWLCMQFSVVNQFFAVLRFWMIFSTALRVLIDPNAPLYLVSGVNIPLNVNRDVFIWHLL